MWINMIEKTSNKQYVLSVFIVPMGIGTKIVSLIRHFNISGGTIMQATGTSTDKIMRYLHLDENHKEIVLIATNLEKSDLIMKACVTKFKFNKPNKGICFSMPLNQIFASKVSKISTNDNERIDNNMKSYKAIYAIVNYGEGESVVQAASDAGARGGTIIHGRGAGVHETAKIFAIEIEPEKEIVLILVEDSIYDQVCEAILTSTNIEQSGHGIMFTHDVLSAYGLVQ